MGKEPVGDDSVDCTNKLVPRLLLRLMPMQSTGEDPVGSAVDTRWWRGESLHCHFFLLDPDC